MTQYGSVARKVMKQTDRLKAAVYYVGVVQMDSILSRHYAAWTAA